MSAEASLILASKFYDSAYPGSMCARADGDFVQRFDAASLAGALLALIRSKDRDLEDALASLENVVAERNKLAAAHVPSFEDLMQLHGISVWQDPDWNGGRFGTPRWVAGVDFHVENGTYYSTLTGCGSASIEARFTASGDSPSAAVFACVAAITKASP